VNSNPDDFFGPQGGERRAVFTIGVPGSGKSVICTQAKDKGWHVVNADELRVHWLSDMQRQQETITVGGQKELADPRNPRHVFSDELRVKVRNAANLFSMVKDQPTVLWDLTNLTLDRVYLMQLCRQAGYSIEALVFVPTETDWHVRNVESRVAQGGLDLASPDQSAEAKTIQRRRVVEELKRTFEIFSGRLSIDAHKLKQSGTPPIVELQSLRRPSNARTLKAWLDELPDGLKGQVATLKAFDVFQKAHWIECRDFV
jgi:predicted ABC-type ATPase